MRSSVIVSILVLCAAGGWVYGFDGGDGSSANPYQISTQAHLESVNSNLSASYILVNDITLAGAYTTAVIAPDTDPNTVEFEGPMFTGSFDGDGHTIAGLTIADANDMTGHYHGLFGFIGQDGVVANVGIINASVAADSRPGPLAG